MLGGLDGVGAVDDVAANLDAEVTTNGARLGSTVYTGTREEKQGSVSCWDKRLAGEAGIEGGTATEKDRRRHDAMQ